MADEHFELLCRMSDGIQEDIENERRDLCARCE